MSEFSGIVCTNDEIDNQEDIKYISKVICKKTDELSYYMDKYINIACDDLVEFEHYVIAFCGIIYNSKELKKELGLRQ